MGNPQSNNFFKEMFKHDPKYNLARIKEEDDVHVEKMRSPNMIEYRVGWGNRSYTVSMNKQRRRLSIYGDSISGFRILMDFPEPKEFSEVLDMSLNAFLQSAQDDIHVIRGLDVLEEHLEFSKHIKMRKLNTLIRGVELDEEKESAEISEFREYMLKGYQEGLFNDFGKWVQYVRSFDYENKLQALTKAKINKGIREYYYFGTDIESNYTDAFIILQLVKEYSLEYGRLQNGAGKLDKKVQELLKRKPSSWGNVSVKSFNQDISLLVGTVLELQKTVRKYENALIEIADTDELQVKVDTAYRAMRNEKEELCKKRNSI